MEPPVKHTNPITKVVQSDIGPISNTGIVFIIILVFIGYKKPAEFPQPFIKTPVRHGWSRQIISGFQRLLAKIP